RRAGLTIAMIGVGLGIVFWLLVIGRSFERSVIDTLSAALRADLTVSSAHIAAGFVEAPVDDALVDALAALPGVAGVAGLRTTEVSFGGGPISLNAFDPAYFASPRFGAWPLVGAARHGVWERVRDGAAVVASTNFLQTFGLAEGAVITLQTPSGPLRLPIAGTTVDYASPRGTLELSRAVYLRHWRDPRVSRVYVTLAPGTSPSAAAAAIRAGLGERYALRILFAGEIVQYFADQVRRAFVGAHVLAGTVFIVVLLGLADTLAAGVMERTRELGTLRAVGVRRAAVRRLVLVESLWLGLSGLGLAALCGTAMGALWVRATFPRLLGWLFDLHLPWRESAAVAVATVAISLLAAALPARRAGRQSPAEALRYE
ncbi:MAG: ABC transporter permease, partial [Deltaproteobacteria bacterium]|nr:ABC transporter permease [Deltaproteobacteria bacterium]